MTKVSIWTHVKVFWTYVSGPAFTHVPQDLTKSVGGVARFQCQDNLNSALFVLNPYQHQDSRYSKVSKFSDTKIFCCKLPKIQTKKPNLGVFCQNSAKGIANSEDPDQTAPLGAVWSGSALFAQTYLSENLGSLRVWSCHCVFLRWSGRGLTY